MRKKIGEWLLDVAKYVTTAVVISSIIEGLSERWMVYCVSVIFTLGTVLIGLYLIDNKIKGGKL